MSTLARIYALLLRLLPRRFREEHGHDLRELLEEYAADRPVWSRGVIVARAVVDVLRVAIVVRIRTLWPNGRRRGPSMERERRTPHVAEAIWQDARHSLRSLRRDAGLAAFATLIVGLGVGASTTVFSVAHAILLRPLPFDDPDRLVWISNGEWGRGQRLSSLSVQVAHVEDLRNGSRLLEGVAGYSLFDGAGDHTLTGSGEPERITRLRVTEGFFELLGVRSRFGRLFARPELEEAGPPAVVLLHGFWERRFAADPEVVGRTILIDGAPATIVGILPASFDFTAIFAPGSRVDYAAPFPLSPENNRRGNTLALIGKLRPGATLEAAQAEASAIAGRAPEDGRNDFTPVLAPLHEHISGGLRTAMLVLAGAVGLVMLLVCANLSNLLLARGTMREKEIAIRAALGATRRRLIRQMLTESVMLALAGAALGLLLAFVGTRALAGMDGNIPLLAHARVDGVALGFTWGVAFLAGLVFGVAPAVRVSASSLVDTLKETSRGSSPGRRHGWMRGALVVSEVALACLLLVGAGLLMRSFVRVLDVDLGFQPRNAVALRIDPSTRFRTDGAREAYYAEALRLVRSASGVEAAGLTDVLPTGFNRRWSVPAPDLASGGARGNATPYVRVISEGYVRAMGLSLVAGRDFTASDDSEAPAVILINEELARSLWPGQDPIGRTLDVWPLEREVIGVVRGTRYLAPEQQPGPELFLPIRQVGDHSAVHVIARGSGPTAVLGATVGDALRRLDARLPVKEVVAIQDMIDRSVSSRRLVVLLLVGFAGFALVLATLGIYGVIAYSVRQRTEEIGIRMALGASAVDVRRRVLVETLELAATGVLLGMPAAWMLGRGMEGMLFGVAASDAATFLAAPLVLIAAAGLAGYIPAKRASGLDPVNALRAERSGT